MSPDPGASAPLHPGEVICASGPVQVVAGAVVGLVVLNTGDRPVQVGSHFHLAEANEALLMDRERAWGHRLAVPAGTAVRFEPGIEREVGIVPLGGARVVRGLRGLAAGPLDRPAGGEGEPTARAGAQGGPNTGAGGGAGPSR